MIKLLLADDEPLVLIGLQSMLKWDDYDIKICGTAHNGEQTLEMIETLSPDIVIADIKMPLKNGLEVLKICREKYGTLPVFIMLTSFEEYDFVKEAINYQALDYLIKMEVTPEILGESVSKALAMLRSLKNFEQPHSGPEGNSFIEAFYEKFFICLYNNLFDSREQFLVQKKELDLDFSHAAYVVCYCEIVNINTIAVNNEKLLILYSSTIQMVRETLNKFLPCYVTSLDMKHFNITFCLNRQETSEYTKHLEELLRHTINIVHNYFNVNLICAAGGKVEDPYSICESYYMARHIFSCAAPEKSLIFFDYPDNNCNEADIFDFSQYKESIAKIFKELDTDALEHSITDIASYFDKNRRHHVQAMDVACNLMYMAISLLPDGESIMQQIFADEEDSYYGIYSKRTVEEIIEWMLKLKDRLCEILQTRKKNYKNRTVSNIQKYIQSNLDKKLSLNEVAALFGFSPNYLSQLFARCTGFSFVEYITNVKISAAKDMLLQGNTRIYEIAENLGFESAFYFSKVFKKVEGFSPREYIQMKL